MEKLVVRVSPLIKELLPTAKPNVLLVLNAPWIVHASIRNALIRVQVCVASTPNALSCLTVRSAAADPIRSEIPSSSVSTCPVSFRMIKRVLHTKVLYYFISFQWHLHHRYKLTLAFRRPVVRFPRVKTGEVIRLARACLITSDRHLIAVPNVRLTLIVPAIKLASERNAETLAPDPVALMPCVLWSIILHRAHVLTDIQAIPSTIVT